MALWLVTWACWSETAAAAVVQADDDSEAIEKATALHGDGHLFEPVVTAIGEDDLLVRTEAPY